ncbi:MAG: hypothetical protein GY801_22600 [bacterium]|nr:hypothetical protein [bacterium]
MATLRGIVRFKDVGMGCWEFAAQDDRHYEIIGGDDALYQDGQQAKITGQVRNDLMSAGNIGPIFEVQSVELS